MMAPTPNANSNAAEPDRVERLAQDARRVERRYVRAFRALDAARSSLAGGHYRRARWRLARYLRKVRYDAFPRHDGRESIAPLLSIVIVAYRTGHELLECVGSVLSGALRAVEVIVVDNGGNDAVVSALLELPLLYVRCPVNLGASEGRNVGVHFARADITAFLDDDAVALPDHAAATLRAFEHDEVLAVRGLVRSKREDALVPTAPHYDYGPDPVPALIETEGNAAVRTEVYRAVEGMDPLLWGHEGTELSCRILMRYGPGRILYWPAAVIRHDFAITDSKLGAKNERHRQMWRYMRWRIPDAPAIVREHRELREKREAERAS